MKRKSLDYHFLKAASFFLIVTAPLETEVNVEVKINCINVGSKQM